MRPHHARRLLAALFACLATATVSTAALAEPLAYATGFHTLYQVDLANGQATRIGPDAGIGFNDVEALAIAPSGVLFGVADATRILPGGGASATTDFLFTVSTTNGAGVLIGQLPGLQGQGPNGNLDYGMNFTCDGRLWLSSATTSQFWSVNPGTAEVSLVGNLGVPISGMAARGGTLYGVSISPQPSLYRIDVDTAAVTLVGPLAIGGVVSSVGLSFDMAGQLWATLGAVLDGNLNPSRAVRINTDTGAATLVSNVNLQGGAVQARALAIAPPAGCAAFGNPTPVPGPGLPLLILLAAVAAGIGGRRLSRR